MRLSPRPVLLAVVALLLGLVVPLAANPAGADPRHRAGSPATPCGRVSPTRTSTS